MHKASHLLTLNLVCVCVCDCVPSTVYQSTWGESACRGVSGGLRYSACCQHRHISPSAPLHRYANPASSECRAPDQLQFIPFCSLCTHPPSFPLRSRRCLFLSPSPPLSSCLHSVFGFLFGLLFMAYALSEELREDLFWAASSLSLTQRSTSFFQSSTTRGAGLLECVRLSTYVLTCAFVLGYVCFSFNDCEHCAHAAIYHSFAWLITSNITAVAYIASGETQLVSCQAALKKAISPTHSVISNLVSA